MGERKRSAGEVKVNCMLFLFPMLQNNVMFKLHHIVWSKRNSCATINIEKVAQLLLKHLISPVKEGGGRRKDEGGRRKEEG